MLNVSPVELLMVLMVGLIVLGPQKLPQIARQVGKALAEVRKMAGGFEREFREAVKELDIGDTAPPSPSPRGPTPLAPTPDEAPTTTSSEVTPAPLASTEPEGAEETRTSPTND